jgi:methylmalonyl-CoA mutase C-terminal domain/subunit
MAHRHIRVLMAKVGLDGHDRGVKVVARALRDAGFEVIYTGLHRSPEEVISSAVDEDVDVIGVSILSGAHMTIFPRLLELMRENDLDDVLLLGGGTFPPDEILQLQKAGVHKIFAIDTPLSEIVEFTRANARAKAGTAA